MRSIKKINHKGSVKRRKKSRRLSKKSKMYGGDKIKVESCNHGSFNPSTEKCCKYDIEPLRYKKIGSAEITLECLNKQLTTINTASKRS